MCWPIISNGSCPLVAAYFAVENGDSWEKDEDEPAIYSFPISQDFREISANLDIPPLDQTRAAPLRLPQCTPRITAQVGTFTIHPDPETPLRPEGLEKVAIAAKFAPDLKQHLNQLGVNRASLFPDLDGIAAHVDWLYRNHTFHPPKRALDA